MKLRINVEQGWYQLTLAIWCFFEVLTQSNLASFLGIDIDLVNTAVTSLVLVSIVCYCIFGQTYEKQELYIISIITIFIIIATLKSGINTVMSAWIFIVAGKNLNFCKMVKIVYRALLFSMLIVIGMYLMGFIKEYTYYRNDIVRHSLGFSHPNGLGMRIFQLVACRFYIRWNRLNLLDALLTLLMAIFTYQVTNSQTATICIILLMLITLVVKIVLNKWENAKSKVGTYLWLGGCIIGVLDVVLTYTDVQRYKILHTINLFVSSRFSEGHKVLNMYGVSLFGQKIYVSKAERALVGIKQNLFLDSGYMTLLVRMGLVVFIIVIIGYFYNFYRHRSICSIAVILFVYSVYGIMESGLFQLTQNIFLLTFAWTLYPQKCIDGLTTVANEYRTRYISKGKQLYELN